MLHIARWIAIPMLAVGWLAADRAWAVAPAVRDDAEFFKAETIKKANEVIKEIKQDFKKDLLIETFPTVQKDQIEGVKKMSPKEKAEFFDAWAERRAKESEVNGIYILITRQPGHIEVVVGEATRQKAFKTSDAADLRRMMVESFKVEDYDKGLLDGVEFVKSTLQGNQGKPKTQGQKAATDKAPAGGQVRPETNSGGTNWLGLICIGLVVILGVWLVVGLIRAFTSNGGGWGGGGYGGGGYGGGGFLPGLMGGLFGAMAGMYLYDTFMGHHSDLGNTAHAADPGVTGTDSPGTDVGGDYESTGGDFDQGGEDFDAGGGDFDAGGGDVGGGDFGGGDFGGGDFGGGDFGGGDF